MAEARRKWNELEIKPPGNCRSCQKVACLFNQTPDCFFPAGGQGHYQGICKTIGCRRCTLIKGFKQPKTSQDWIDYHQARKEPA